MVNYRPPLIGIVGKTNVGKSTLFSAITMTSVEISNRPFTTIDPNHGIGYVRIKCPHVDFGLKECNPRTGYCIEGNRFVPVELLDVAGLIPGAHQGKGLGNKFMDDLRKADAFILVVDASGSTDEEGVPLPPGSRDPVSEAKTIINEIHLWLARVISDDWNRFSMATETSRKDVVEALYEKVSGLSIGKNHVLRALDKTGLHNKKLSHWTHEDILFFATILRETAKPFVIAANKIDLPTAREGYERLRKAFPDTPVIPVSAEAELALKKAAKHGLVRYIPGDNGFEIVNPDALSPNQRKALDYIRERVFEVFDDTGVQALVNTIVFNVLGKVIVFPVEDVSKLTDKKGNILPDALIVDKESSPKEVAGLIHSDLEKGFLYAIDARTKQRLGENHKVYDRMVLKIVSSI